ncbi:MAG: SET domain-containing protein [Vicinamibacteria bacterium]|nr:SET domain-containing protein [Vicinamibacteria bacterium]
MHPFTELRQVSDEVGLGVFATRDIQRGTLVWTRCLLERPLPLHELHALPAHLRDVLETYGFLCSDGQFVLPCDMARYVNHSCDPTSVSLGDGFELAARDIAAGEQMTNEYGDFYVEYDMACHCGAAACRGVVRRDDVRAHHEAWDRRARQALGAAAHVPQPLLPHALAPAVFEAMLRDPELVAPHARHLDSAAAALLRLAPQEA